MSMPLADLIADHEADNRNPLRILRALFADPDGSVDAFTCQCPRHKWKSRCLLVIRTNRDEPVLHCGRGCTQEQVLNHVGFTSRDLSAQLVRWWCTADVPPPKTRRR
jgi:hypothetical protein